MLKLARRAKGHFMTLIEIRVHLIRYKPGHISEQRTKKRNPLLTPSLGIGNPVRATLVGGECSHHYVSPAPPVKEIKGKELNLSA